MKTGIGSTVLLLLMIFTGSKCFAQKDTLIVFQNYETGLYGYQDANFDEAIAAIYEYAGDFSEGFAVVQSGAQVSLIDKTGKAVLPLDFSTTQSVKNGLIAGQKEEKYGCIDLKGNVVIPFEYSYMAVLGKDLLMYGNNGKFGIIHRNGNKITQAVYDDIDYYYDGMIRVLKDRKYGFVNTTGTEVIPCTFEYTKYFCKGVCPVEDASGLWGLIDRKGKYIMEPKYDGITEFTDDRASVSINMKSGFIDLSGKEITELKYENYTLFNNGLAAVNDGLHWGVIDLSGKEIVPVEYYDIEFPEAQTILAYYVQDETTLYSLFDRTGKPLCENGMEDITYLGNSLYRVGNNELAGMIDRNGKQILPAEYSNIGLFHQNVSIVEKDNQSGIINTKGEIIVEFGKYDYFDMYSRGFIRVSKNDLEGYLDLNGKEIIPVRYSELGYFSGPFTHFERDGVYGLIDRNGNEKDYIYDAITDFTYGLAMVSANDKVGFINNEGIMVIPMEYDYAEPFSSQYTWCSKNNKYGIIDTKGNEVVPFIYDSFETLFNTDPNTYNYDPIGYKVVGNGKTGVIQMDGTETIPVIYDFIGEFNEHQTAWARLNGKLGGIGFDNTVVLPFQFDEIGIFRDGYAKASVDGNWGIIDKYGNIVIEPKYSFVNSLVEEMAAVQTNNLWGFCHISGREVVAPTYQAVENFKEGYAAVQLNNKWGFIDKDGVVVVPAIYDSVTDFNGGFSIAVSGKKKYSIEAGMFTRTRLKQ